MRVDATATSMFVLGNCIAHGNGRSSAISRSNSRKVIATRKNFIENGSRAELMGSNPHSYGLAFSVYTLRCGSQKATEIRAIVRVMLISKISIKLITLF